MDVEYELKNLDEMLLLDIKKRVDKLFFNKLSIKEEKILELDKKSLETFKDTDTDYYYSKVLAENLISKIDYLLKEEWVIFFILFTVLN